jgi:hypothetical protein
MSILLDLGPEDMHPERNMVPTNSAAIVVRISYSSLAPPIYHNLHFALTILTVILFTLRPKQSCDQLQLISQIHHFSMDRPHNVDLNISHSLKQVEYPFQSRILSGLIELIMNCESSFPKPFSKHPFCNRINKKSYYHDHSQRLYPLFFFQVNLRLLSF